MRVTIACPEEHIEKANQYARCVGRSEHDDKTFSPAYWVDSSNRRYSVASGIVSDDFEEKALSELVEPEWGCNLALAIEAQVLIQQGIIAYVKGDDVWAAVNTLGVTPLPDNEEAQ